ncbi:MAG: OmpA family protein, partial [Myxococcales bacterium]|nr:OmpA family protein [Myxococcales bacterium]
ADDEIGVPWPSLYLGASAGGHFVLTDWDFGEIDGEGRPVSPESSFIGKLRIGFQAAEWLALEASVGHFAFKASTETNPGWLYEIDGLFFLKNAPWSGFVLVGAGLYHNAAPDLVDSEADFAFHVGLGTKYRVAHYVWLRGEVRYYLADSLDPDLPIASNLEATLGLDFMLWGPDPAPVDTDKDGIIDSLDRCPTVPGQKETEGCPDRDRDGIVDAEDACPDAAGPAENKGCPDRDGDGILDKDDKCPDTPGIPEEQGCPIGDRDKDGIPDDKDVCPDTPEDLDGIEDSNGCPEDDADQDGILDAVDKCPLKAEVRNGFEDEDGCPDEAPKVVVTCERVELTESVYFDTAKYSIQARSFPLLDQVAQALNENAHIKKVRIEGHTDNQGNDGFNLTLSNNRAREVRIYLIGKGVDEKRLTSKGYGETRPIATNETEQGRAQNRRVDFVITDQDKREGCE